MVQHIFAQATTAHNAGDLPRAEALYRQVLALAPQHSDALHLLGRLACDVGNAPAAVPLLREAIRLRPRIAEYQAALAEAQRALGQIAVSLETWRRAVRLKPESAALQLGHGMALAAAGQSAAALQAMRRAVSRDPNMLAAHSALGALLLAEGQAQAATESFRAANRLAPGDGITLFNLGCSLQAQDNWAEAEQVFRRAVALMPGHLPSRGNLSRVLQSDGRLGEAAAILETIVGDAPGEMAAWLNLGLIRREQSRFTAAETAFRQADALASSAATMACIGNVLRDQGRLAESEAAFLAALRRDAAHAECHIGLAVTRLLRGDWRQGWPEFGWRTAAPRVRARLQALAGAPVWQGQPVDGALLIYAEQGAGDFIQMSRFVARAARLASGIILYVPAELRRLATAVPGAGTVVEFGEQIPPCAAMCADMDLPAIFDVALADAAMPGPYLAADGAEHAAWRERMERLPGRKVGLAWAGNPGYFHDRQRSVPPEALSALAGIEGITFVSLQPGARPPPSLPPPSLPLHDEIAALHDFAATAALISALDLVICVDSAVAHLAGALGRPVWLLNRYAPDWRWLLDRDDSPWYSTLRQFRQAAPGDWQDVLARVRAALSDPDACPP